MRGGGVVMSESGKKNPIFSKCISIGEAKPASHTAALF